MKNKKKFKEYMTGLGEIFNKEITDTLKNIYWEILKPFTDVQCELAFNKLISTCKFFPKPSEFIKILRGDDNDRSLRAWQGVTKALENGLNNFDDEITNQCIQVLGGWNFLFTRGYEELEWIEKRFHEHYQSLDKRQEFDLLEYKEMKQLQ